MRTSRHVVSVAGGLGTCKQYFEQKRVKSGIVVGSWRSWKQSLEDAEIKLRRQSVGPRGPQGPLDRSRKETLESIVVQSPQEYHALNENALPCAGPYAK